MMVWVFDWAEGDKECLKILAMKPLRKAPFVRLSTKWKYSIKIDLRKTGCANRWRLKQAQYVVPCQASVLSVLKLHVLLLQC
jgi:hypothetical protein